MYSTFLIIQLIYKYEIKQYVGYIIAKVYPIYGLKLIANNNIIDTFAWSLIQSRGP